MTSDAETLEVAGEPQPDVLEVRASRRDRLFASWRQHVWRRHHLPFAVLFLGGVVLRYVTWRAYRPVLLFPDSHNYLRYAQHLDYGYWQPSGYPAFLWPLLRLHHPTLIPLIQHGLTLAIVVVVYLLLQRWRVPAWGAALATAPLLFDPLQLNVEQYLLSDVLFQSLVCAAIAATLWRRRPGPWALAFAGVCIGLATLTRNAGMFTIAALVVGAVAMSARWRAVAALLVGFLLPVGAYVVGHHANVGTYAITDTGGRYLYGRLASTVVKCETLTLPDYERQLCPPEPYGHRPSSDHYVWGYKTSPQYQAVPPPGMTQLQMVKDFDKRVVRQQPLAYVKSVGWDFLRGFQPTRQVRSNDIRFLPFEFQKTYPTRWIRRSLAHQEQLLGIDRVSTDRPKAAFLHSYGRWFHVPGPLFGGCLLLAVAAIVGAGRAKHSGLRSATWVFAGTAVLVLLPASMAVGFSWRYQMQQFMLLPAAGALALTALLRRPVPTAGDGEGATLAVDRFAEWLLRAPMPRRARAFAESGHAVLLIRYTLGSVICTVVSAVAFVVLFGGQLAGSKTSSLAASGIAAIVGYYLNRRWTWGATHKPDFRTESVPYWTTIVVSAVLAALATGGANSVMRHVGVSHGVRTMVDLLAYLGTYAVAFVAKYVLFNRIFGKRQAAMQAAQPPLP